MTDDQILKDVLEMKRLLAEESLFGPCRLGVSKAAAKELGALDEEGNPRKGVEIDENGIVWISSRPNDRFSGE